MPANINYQQFNQNNPSFQGYDLAEERQRIAEGTEEIKKELLAKWQKRYANAEIFPKKLASLNRELIDFLLSFEHTLFYNQLAKNFHLSQEQRNVLPQLVWQICLSQNWQNFPILLKENLSLTPEAHTQIITSIQSKIILPAQRLFSATPISRASLSSSITSSPLISLPLAQALQEIPEIGEQLLTTERIQILTFPDPVRPSLKNWLADYTSYFGYEKHTTMEISNYLFHSANTSRLSSSDREKVRLVIQAFNDQTPLTINKSTKQIVFSATNQPVTLPNSLPKNPPTAPEPQMTFSSPQKFTSESNLAKNSFSTQKTSSAPRNLPFDSQSNPRTFNSNTIVLQKKPPTRPEGKNVVDLREN